MSIKELSQYTGFKISYIYHLTYHRKIPYKKPANKLIFNKKEIDDWINQSTVDITSNL